MREINPPDPIEVTDDKGKTVLYGLENFVSEFVYTDKRFRDEWSASFDVLVTKFTPKAIAAARKAKTPILLCDEQYDHAKAILKAVEVGPGAQVMLMPFFHAFTQAKFRDEKADKPEPKKKAAR